MTRPADHPDRHVLNDEVHARPPEPLRAPARLSYLALLSPQAARDDERARVGALCERFGAPLPAPAANHHSADLGAFRLVWERHSEFARYTFIAPAAAGAAPWTDPPALSLVPADWLAALPGRMIVATHALLTCDLGERSPEDLATTMFAGNLLVGSDVAGGAAFACTDFRIHSDGFGRLLVADRGLTARQAGRTLQRLLEIDTYRMMALLALPVARATAPFLAECEAELKAIATALVSAAADDEAALLERLTRLEAAIAGRSGDNDYRFGAAAAYEALVHRRIAELREQRVPGLQTFGEFIERRLAPAMGTCHSIAARQDRVSLRAQRTTQLLSTRVDLTREHQNLAILRAMNRRADIQLRLQATVESLSVAAVTYYVVGLVAYAAKSAAAWGVPINGELAIGISIPVVAGIAALGLRRVHRLVAHRDR
ncbi:MAG: DUF3422 domain-containing protein [Reyranellaceae bacterium]